MFPDDLPIHYQYWEMVFYSSDRVTSSLLGLCSVSGYSVSKHFRYPFLPCLLELSSMIQRTLNLSWNMRRAKVTLRKEISSISVPGISLVCMPLSWWTELWHHIGNGIINSDGELWKVQRKAGMQFLNNTNLKILTDVALPRYLRSSIEYLRKRGKEKIIDLEGVMLELTTQIMGRMAYDVRSDMPLY